MNTKIEVDWCKDNDEGIEYSETEVIDIPSYIPEDQITDYLSDTYGWLVNSWKVVDKNQNFNRILTMKTLDDLLEEISVVPPGQWENEFGPKGWYAVCNNEGIIAYFNKENLAFGFRLWYINSILNPL